MTTGPKRRRRALSLNGLAIQVSAFALSFTLVALFVVGSSRAAFVEQNETVANRPAAEEPADPGIPVLLPPDPAPRPAEPTAAPRTEPAADPVVPQPVPVQDIELTDDSAGTAMYTDEDGLVPGVPEERCIRVTVDSTLDPRPVVFYATDVEGPLAPHLDVVVEMGAEEGSFGDCTDFSSDAVIFSGSLAELRAAHMSYDTGVATWDPEGAESRSFRFRVAVRDDPAAEGLSAGFGFTWETRT